MRRIAAIFPVLVAASMYSSTAWACMRGDDFLFIMGFILAPFVAVPYTLLGTSAIAIHARQWYAKPRRGWFIGTIGAYLAAMVGVVLGFGAAQLATTLDSDNLESVLILSTPLVVEVAYLMWLHVRAQRRALAAA